MQMTYLHDPVDHDSMALDMRSDLSHTQKTMPIPLDPPSRDDWLKFKYMIIDLYVGRQNMPLRELVPHMHFHHAFRATERMYKQRFTEWGIFKYRRAAERRLTRSRSGTSSSHSDGTESTAMTRVPSAATSYDLPPTVSSEHIVSSPTSLRSCQHAASCSHRHCIQSFLFDLALRADEASETSIYYLSRPEYTIPPLPEPIEEVLYHVREFSLSWLDPEDSSHNDHIVDAAAQAKRLTSNIIGHCSHRSSPKQCERCTWSEFDFGLAMLEDGHSDLAFTSFHLGCRLAHLLLSSPSKLFIRNLIMAFGTHRWQKFESLRHQLLNYLALMASEVLGEDHSITIILKHASRDNTLQKCAERALETMIEVSETALSPTHPDVLLIKRSLSVILRREENYTKSEDILLKAIADSEAFNGPHAKETRRCLRRLGHLYMEQCRWDESEEVFLRILGSAPGKSEYKENWIPDEISVYTYQHLAKMYNDMGDLANSRYWLSQELMAAIKRWGTQGEYTAECLQLAYNETPLESLSTVIEQYPEILLQAESMFRQGRIVISKTRWCAVRNLI